MAKLTKGWLKADKRLAIYLRDGCACIYCGTQVEPGQHNSNPRAATVDHVLSRESGGDNKTSNLVTCCTTCNSTKQDKPVSTFLAQLAEDKGVCASAAQMRLNKAQGTPLKPYRDEAKRIRAERKAQRAA